MVRVQFLCSNSPGKWYIGPQFRFFIFLNPGCNIYKFKKNSKRYTMRSQLICTMGPISSEIGFTRDLWKEAMLDLKMGRFDDSPLSLGLSVPSLKSLVRWLLFCLNRRLDLSYADRLNQKGFKLRYAPCQPNARRVFLSGEIQQVPLLPPPNSHPAQKTYKEWY